MQLHRASRAALAQLGLQRSRQAAHPHAQTGRLPARRLRPQEAAELICRSGFDVRLASAQGSLGAGLYFGSASAISAQFCTRAFNPEAVQALGHQPAEPGLLGAAAPGGGPRFQYNGYAMLLCRVAVGTAGTGSRGARAPQPGCHSAEGNGTMHVVYQSDQVGCPGKPLPRRPTSLLYCSRRGQRGQRLWQLAHPSWPLAPPLPVQAYPEYIIHFIVTAAGI